jgi:hypothetical protein
MIYIFNKHCVLDDWLWTKPVGAIPLNCWTERYETVISGEENLPRSYKPTNDFELNNRLHEKKELNFLGLNLSMKTSDV